MDKHTSEDAVQKSGEMMQSHTNHSSHVQRSGLFSYFKASWSEFKKVVWPTRKDALRMTMFVIIFVIVMSIFIYIVDNAISWLFFDVLLKKGE